MTPDADRVEVLAFQTYGHPGWTSNHNVEIMWSRTLPEAVDVVYLPEKALRQITKRPRIQALHATRQNLYQTAVAMGVPPWDAHHLIVQAMIHSNKALESERTHRNYAKLLDLDPDAFQAQRSVSGHYGPWLRDCPQCDGGSWWCGPRSERIGASANSDFHIRGVSSMARLAGCTLIRWSTSTR